MKSLKELLFSGMFVVMAAALLVACGDGEGDGTTNGADAKTDEVVTPAVDTEEEWLPEDVVANSSAANK